MVVISGSVLSKEAVDTWDKKIGSTIILPKEPSYYSIEIKYLILNAGAAVT